MSEWKQIQFRNICSDISYGYTASASNENVGPKFLRITDISSGRINWKNVPYCKISNKDLKKYQLGAGDIVIARTGATTGYNAIIKNKVDAVYASYLIRFQIDFNKADPFFVGHVLQSNNFQDYVDSIAGGSAQPGANAQQFADYEFLLPPLSEQKLISEVLTSLDDKIDLLHRQNKILEALAETLFRQQFLEEAVDSWEVGTLSDLVIIKYGKDHKRLLNGNIPVFGSGGLMRYSDTALYDMESVLIPRKGSLNNVMYIDEPFWTVDTMFYTIMKRSYIAKFIYHFVKGLDLASMNVGSAVPSMTTDVLNNISIEIPPEAFFQNFDKSLSPLYLKMKSNQSQIKTLTQMRDMLLPKLMSGEVIVKK